MEPEIELELFAALCADVEAGKSLAEVLRAEGLLQSTWEHSRDLWMGRMSNESETERKTLEGRYLAAFHARKRTAPTSVGSATHPVGDDDPPTPRAPMGTVIMPLDPEPHAGARAEDRGRETDPPSATPPMGVPAPNPIDRAPPSVTPPMGVMGPNAIDRGPPSATPPMGVIAPKPVDTPNAAPPSNPELTPPMGVAAPRLGDIAPPSRGRTPPMGIPAPSLAEIPPPRPLRMPEPTPPMRPRSDFIPDGMVRATSEAVADRKTDPPAAVPSRPALPFPAQTQPAGPAQSVPLPPASAPFRSPSGGGYPAVPTGQPMQYPQATQSASTPAYGGYPAMLSLAAQAIAAHGSGAASSPGYGAPPKPVGPPVALAGFSATTSGPRLTLEAYAAFAAEIAVKPLAVAEIRERYSLTDTAHAAEDDAWQRRFSSDRETYVRYAKLFQHYRDWFSGRTPR